MAAPVEDVPVRAREALAEAIAAAWRRRDPLHGGDADTDAYRLFHGDEEGCPGLAIDRYGEAAIIAYRPERAHAAAAAAAALDALGAFASVVARPAGGAPALVRGRRVERVAVREESLRFWVEPMRRGNPGLYLDGRPARRWICEHSRGRAVLNLFSFTGASGVAAAVGGARAVTHADMAAEALARARANHELNRVPVDDRALMRVNIYQHIRRASASRRRFDAIVVDPPPPSAHARRSDRTPGRRGVVALAPRAARMLAPGGWMLCFFHARGPARGRDRGAIENEVITAAGIPLEVIWRGGSGADFPAVDPRRALRVTAFARPV